MKKNFNVCGGAPESYSLGPCHLLILLAMKLLPWRTTYTVLAATPSHTAALTVYAVRPAEKDLTAGLPDPILTAAGQARAQAGAPRQAYCGAVGGRPMTVALAFTPVADKKPAGCEGSHFYGCGNKYEPYLSTSADHQALGPLSLAEYDGQKKTDRWRAV